MTIVILKNYKKILKYKTVPKPYALAHSQLVLEQAYTINGNSGIRAAKGKTGSLHKDTKQVIHLQNIRMGRRLLYKYVCGAYREYGAPFFCGKQYRQVLYSLILLRISVCGHRRHVPYHDAGAQLGSFIADVSVQEVPAAGKDDCPVSFTKTAA
jgi:hypothetical protein